MSPIPGVPVDASELLDCLIVGGGPAGLTAAIYLARFHLSVLVADSGESRADQIPLTRNFSGFPDGIAGSELRARMREQGRRYGVRHWPGKIVSLKGGPGLFVAHTMEGMFQARTVLMATGVLNRRPSMPANIHDEALSRGLLRYCPICDGYEVTDSAVAVIGTGEHGTNEAEFLRSYTTDVTLIAPTGNHELDAAQRSRLKNGGIQTADGPCLHFELMQDGIAIATPTGRRLFATVYAALGSDVRSELAVAMDAEVSRDGCLIVDEHQRTSVAGLYAAGDVVRGLDQLSYAIGQGGVAAVAIRNDLACSTPLRR
ncbi:NAD(P)/FAD-dependent oxidoreductase [Mesorhizobium comanense]|jgi:thioredoxin reductase (NADPH)|uniref:NAD(P)/FAD-dependent oxidoreductase n=1 Tax=Mesorhizobium comanense TaxID=2502215 RepID=UPI0010F7D725|nr:NAD(P)/FAD-dependent oxidoreductase [Mesorhizobium comanense]